MGAQDKDGQRREGMGSSEKVWGAQAEVGVQEEGKQPTHCKENVAGTHTHK